MKQHCLSLLPACPMFLSDVSVRCFSPLHHNSFQTASKLYLVLDFINGGHLFFNLYRQVSKGGLCVWAGSLKAARQVINLSAPLTCAAYSCLRLRLLTCACCHLLCMLCHPPSYTQGVFDEDVARLYTAEIVAALSYLHDRGIVHRCVGVVVVLFWEGGGLEVGIQLIQMADASKVSICAAEAGNLLSLEQHLNLPTYKCDAPPPLTLTGT
jgi:hypothetical protein